MKMKITPYVIALIILIAGLFFDRQIVSFLAVNRTDFIISIMNWFSFFGTWFIVLIIMTSLFLWQEHKRKWILPLWLSLGISFAVTYGLKLFIMRDRPAEALSNSLTSGFPSGHATAVFSGLAVLDKEFPRFKWFWLVFALIVVFSRLYLGMHYLTDVVVGMVIGYTTGLLITKYIEYQKSFMDF